ncbi:hypothetical protein EDB19DRAFT_1830953 [Suillus lakei]|nr:hypothetical protein EDB19DRAFT_1830953 [Suillus lakei]
MVCPNWYFWTMIILYHSPTVLCSCSINKQGRFTVAGDDVTGGDASANENSSVLMHTGDCSYNCLTFQWMLGLATITVYSYDRTSYGGLTGTTRIVPYDIRLAKNPRWYGMGRFTGIRTAIQTYGR